MVLINFLWKQLASFAHVSLSKQNRRKYKNSFEFSTYPYDSYEFMIDEKMIKWRDFLDNISTLLTIKNRQGINDFSIISLIYAWDLFIIACDTCGKWENFP